MRLGGSAAAMAVVLLLATAFAPPAGASLSGAFYEPEPPAFCGEPTVHDYLAPLERMPRLHQPGKELGFGPSGLELILGARSQNAPSLVAPGGELRYLLADETRHVSVSLGWRLTGELTRVDARGRPVGRALVVHQQVASVATGTEPHHEFELGGRRGFYRLTVTIEGRHGNRLGTFGTYVRVVRPTFQPTLVLSAPSFRPGSTLFARIENRGTLDATYGIGYAIERPGPAGWERAPESPRGPVPAIAFFAGPGQAGRCTAFNVPPTMTPGPYRISKTSFSDAASLAQPDPARPIYRTVSAEFEVAP